MSKGFSAGLRILKPLGWSALGLVLALYIGLPVAMAVVAVWPSRTHVGERPTEFSDVALTTSDGVRLTCWYVPSKNGVAIVLVPGAGESREGSRHLAQMLAGDGYGVLSVDLRGHGSSGGRTNRLGWRGTRDIRAAVDYLVAHEPDALIGGVGLSMGGEVLLGASASCPEMRAIVADGATRRCTSELMALPSKRSLAENFAARVMYAAVGVVSGESPPSPLLDEMIRANSTSFLLVAAGDNALEVAFNEHFAQMLGDRATLWVAPGVAHVGAYSKYPREYEERVLGFLGDRLLPSASVLR